MLRIELSVDKATNGFVVYNGDNSTICSDADSVVKVLQELCQEKTVKWVESLITGKPYYD